MGIKQAIYLFFFAIGCLAQLTGSAQDYSKKSIDGRDYYLYFVEPGNTLFAISKMFSVEVDALVNANPGAENGLDIGQELLIPIKSIDKKVAKKTDVSISADTIFHAVAKKETLFSISKSYGVTVNELTEWNPESAQTLSVGTVLRIPSSKSRNVEESFLEPARNDSFIVHMVSPGETVYSLSQLYEISDDSLYSFNPNLDLGLKTGQYLVIPKYRPDFTPFNEQVEVSPEFAASLPTGAFDTYQIGLMLPFELELNDSLEKALIRGEELYILTEIALEYYRGTKIALDSLRKMGLNAEVHVFDIGEDIVKTREALKKPELKKMNIIFGPMHKASLAMVSDETKKNKTYLVSPNSFNNSVFEDNPYLMRSRASRETLVRYLANYLAINHSNHNVIMVNSESPKDWPLRKSFIENYNLALGTFPNDYADSLRSVTKAMFEEEPETSVLDFLREDTLNVLVVPSNELAFVSDMMTRISLLDEEKYRIQVYGLDKWINYENIEAEYKNKLNLRLVVSGYVDYDNEITIDFLEKYRENYGTEPTHFDYGFKGYDLTMFFGKALLERGLSFPLGFDNLEMEGTTGNYRFGKSMSGDEFENKSAYILEYDEYQIKRVN